MVEDLVYDVFEIDADAVRRRRPDIGRRTDSLVLFRYLTSSPA